MFPFTLLTRFWRRRQRTIDRTYLFPIIRGHQESADAGLQAILTHIALDKAWRFPDEWQREPLEQESCQ